MLCEVCREYPAGARVEHAADELTAPAGLCEACAARRSPLFARALALSLAGGLAAAEGAERAAGVAYLRQLAGRLGGGPAPPPLRRLFGRYGVA